MITEEDVRDWLGSDNTLEEALKCLVEIANGEYRAEQLESDIDCYRAMLGGHDYVWGKW